MMNLNKSCIEIAAFCAIHAPVVMNLNKSCIEIMANLQTFRNESLMNLNKSCIEIMIAIPQKII